MMVRAQQSNLPSYSSSSILGIFVILVVYFIHGIDSKSYPAYCAKEISQNRIVPILNTIPHPNYYGTLTLQQVQIVIRHGARTPCEAPGCWPRYNLTWNCNVREHSFPQLMNSKKSQHYLYDKIYQDGMNVLKGNCHLGQLLDEGYEMELQNGKTFRNAYFGNQSHHLFHSNEVVNLKDPLDIFLESDDEQRTVMSGQLVVDGMFPNENQSLILPWHCGDLSETDYFPNEKVCPYLTKIKENWKNSPEYKTWKNQKEYIELHKELFFGLGSYSKGTLFDCMMTAICDDQQLPSIFNSSLIRRIMDHENENIARQFNYNNAEYSKIGMSSFLKRIRQRLVNKVTATNPSPRFVLYSGHDTTIMPLLATFGKKSWTNEWIPYASYVAIELYRSTTKGNLVRLLFQGQPVPIEGCFQGICELSKFLELTSFVQNGPICHQNVISMSSSNSEVQRTSFVSLAMTLLLGVVVGVSFTILIIQKTKRNVHFQPVAKDEMA